jgi:Uma2 family endonuclease
VKENDHMTEERERELREGYRQQALDQAIELARRYTIADLAWPPQEGKRRELFAGELVLLDSCSTDHQTIVSNVYVAARQFLREHPLGRIFFGPVDMVLDVNEVYVPDIVFISNTSLEIVGERIEGAPSWVVEVLSDSTRLRDLHAKRDKYLQHGVRTYWVIDPDSDEVRVWENGKGPTFFERGATLSVSSLPGFELRTDEVFNLEF